MGSKCKFCVNYHDDFDTNVCLYEIHDACGGFNRFKYFQLASMVEPSSVVHYSYPDAKDNRVMVMGPAELRQALRERRQGKGWRYSNKAAERLIAEQYDLRSKTPVYSEPSGDDALSLIEKAYSKIISLSKGDERWTMSIPADRANDPDLVIGDALIAAREEIAALRAQLATALKELANLDEQINLRMKAEQETAAIKQAVADTVGGTVEGRPTNTLNYLQRLRELVAEESAQLAEYDRRISGYESESGRLLAEKDALRAQLSEQTKLYDALNWTTHLLCGVGKRGESPEEGEIEAAVKEARAALDGKDSK